MTELTEIDMLRKIIAMRDLVHIELEEFIKQKKGIETIYEMMVEICLKKRL